MKKYEAIYHELRKEYTDEEIAASMLIPKDLNKKEALTAHQELLAFRMNLLDTQSKEQRIYADLLQLRYQIERYVSEDFFHHKQTFSTYLAQYIHALKHTKEALSHDLNIEPTYLDGLLDNKLDPSIDFLYRLEHHNNSFIPALLWWQLIIKKQTHEIISDQKGRKLAALNINRSVKIQL